MTYLYKTKKTIEDEPRSILANNLAFQYRHTTLTFESYGQDFCRIILVHDLVYNGTIVCKICKRLIRVKFVDESPDKEKINCEGNLSSKWFFPIQN